MNATTSLIIASSTGQMLLHKIIEFNIILATPALLSFVFSGIQAFIPQQSKFQDDHELLSRAIIKKRTSALKTFIETAEYVPDTIMEMKEFQGEDLFLALDKYGDYRAELDFLKRDFYSSQSVIKTVFFLSIPVSILGFIHPYVQVISFIFGVIFLALIALKVKVLSRVATRIHTLKVNPDLINMN